MKQICQVTISATLYHELQIKHKVVRFAVARENYFSLGNNGAFGHNFTNLSFAHLRYRFLKHSFEKKFQPEWSKLRFRAGVLKLAFETWY